MSDEAKALRTLAEELGHRRWNEEDLRRRRKGDKEKARIAAQLRRETTMSLKWIAERPAMGSWNNVSNLLGAARKR